MTKPPGLWTTLGVRVQKHMTDMTIFSSTEKVLKKFPSVSCNLNDFGSGKKYEGGFPFF